MPQMLITSTTISESVTRIAAALHSDIQFTNRTCLFIKDTTPFHNWAQVT